MITIPRRERQVKENITNAQFSANPSREAFGGGNQSSFNEASKLADKVSQYEAQERKKANSLEVENAYAELVKEKNNLLYSEEDGFKKLGGRDTGTQFKNYTDRYGKINTDIESRLSNEEQKEEFRRLAGRVGTDLNNQMQGHVFQEFQKYDDEKTKSNLETMHEDAIINHKNPAKLQESITAQQLMIERYGERKGLSPEAIKDRKLQAYSNTHFGVFNRFLVNDEGNLAEAHYNEIKDNLDGTTLIKMENALTSYKARKEREKKSRETALKHDILANLSGMEAIAQEHGDVTELRNAAAQLKEVGDNKWARKVNKKADIYERSYKDLVKIHNLTISEAKDYARNLSVSKDAKEADTELKVKTVIQSAMERRIKEYEKDPVKVVGMFAIGKTGEQVVESRMKLQEQQGHNIKGGFKALTLDEAKQNSMKFQESDSRGKVALIREIDQEYGQHSNQVLRESGISPTVILSKYLPEGTAQETFVMSATTNKVEVTGDIKRSEVQARVRDSEFSKMLNEVRSIMPDNKKVAEQIEDLQRTMVNYGLNTGNESAGVEVLTNSLTVISDDDKKIFFPKDLDEDDIEFDLNLKKEEFKKLVQEDLKDGTLDDFDGELSQFIENDISHLIDDAVWVNSRQGFVLINNQLRKSQFAE